MEEMRQARGDCLTGSGSLNCFLCASFSLLCLSAVAICFFSSEELFLFKFIAMNCRAGMKMLAMTYMQGILCFGNEPQKYNLG